MPEDPPSHMCESKTDADGLWQAPKPLPIISAMVHPQCALTRIPREDAHRQSHSDTWNESPKVQRLPELVPHKSPEV
jgi:hypothetical protein